MIVPDKKPDSAAENLSSQEISSIIKAPPKSDWLLVAPYDPLPKKKLSAPKAGTKSSYGLPISKGLESAYLAYLSGNGKQALDAIGAEEKLEKNVGLLWQLSFLKAQALLMMGKAGDAEAELQKTSQLEVAFTGHNLNSLALRAEVKTWLEDFDGATRDLAFVIKTIGTWELPINYNSFPTNREQLYILTTAKLRAYTVLTAIYIFREDYQAAYKWGEETERLFNNVHFVTNHPLYGLGNPVHIDSYYGRALNLTFLASAQLATTGDMQESEKLFGAADSFYDCLGYSVGKVTTAALKARIYNRLGMYDKCYQAAQEAMKMANEAGLPDYIWRIGILSGKTLLAQGRTAEAEKAFRQAQASADLVSGALSTDHSKIRFGVGKEDITYNLAQIDIQKQDWNKLFEDLEIGRARAFVDLLRDRPVFKNRETSLMLAIDNLDQTIRTIRLKKISPLGDPRHEEEQEIILLKKRAKLVRALQEKDPELACLVAVSTYSLSDVQKGLEQGEVIAYFIPAIKEDKVKFLHITNVSVKLQELPVTMNGLERLMDDFSDVFSNVQQTGARGVIVKPKISGANQVVLLRKAARALKNTFMVDTWGVQSILYIVATGPLHFMAWGILDSNFPISTLPMGSWLNRKKGEARGQGKIVIVGDPEFGGDLPQLPGARMEALTIGRLYKVDPLIGAAATESAMRSLIGDGVPIIHFATHGRFDAVSPMESALYLSDHNRAFPLTAKKMYENPIYAKVVILSACDTGLGKTIAGDDLLGLMRNFYMGGAGLILSSLWEIEDEGTSEFMLQFHKSAGSGNYGRAWLDARNAVRNKGFPASVYGAFNLNGSLR